MTVTMAKVHPTLSLLSRTAFGSTFYPVTSMVHNKKLVSEFQCSFTSSFTVINRYFSAK